MAVKDWEVPNLKWWFFMGGWLLVEFFGLSFWVLCH